LEAIARRTPGFVGADLANLANEAALLAARNGRNSVLPHDFDEAIERVVGGLQKRSRILSEREKSAVAHHEAGHAVVGAVMPGSARVEKISIVPRGLAALGYTWQVPQEENFLMQEDELRGKLATLMGGRASELIMFGKLSTGAGDDLQKATDIAEQAVTLYGMSHLGPMTFSRIQQQYLDPTASPRRGVGPQTAQQIDAEIQSYLTEAQSAAQQVLRANESLVREIAQRLLVKEVMDGPELYEVLGQAVLPESVRRWLQASTSVDTPQPLQPDDSLSPLVSG
jgi:cell division protease FtsH